jgi:type VII secretion protein EccB
VTQQSRKDLYQAHRLMTQRAALALLRGEPDVVDQPLRRLNVAAISSVLVAIIIAALFVILAILGHGGAALQREPGTLIIDKQTGQAYVFCGKDKKEICAVINYASARLALRSTPASLDQQTVNQAALTRWPRGPLIGIPGLPQPLPEASLLIRQPWSVCEQTERALSGRRTVTALAGGITTGGRSLGGDALLVQDLNQDWVIWGGERMAIQPALLTAVFAGLQPVPVPTVWLNSLPEGPAFAPLTIQGAGDIVAGVSGGTARVGQLYQVNAVVGSPARYYVQTSAGRVTQITETQFRLMLQTNPPSMPQPTTLRPSQVIGHASSTVLGGGLPANLPAILGTNASEPLCVVYAAAADGTLHRQVMAGGRMPSGGSPTSDPTGVGQVVLPAEKGALVGAAPGAGQAGSAVSYFLVAGGRRYALASRSVAGFLGYRLSESVLLPASFVDLIPQGPALSPAAAVLPVPPGG